MKLILYKVNTNFFQMPLYQGFQAIILLSGNEMIQILLTIHILAGMRFARNRKGIATTLDWFFGGILRY